MCSLRPTFSVYIHERSSLGKPTSWEKSVLLVGTFGGISWKPLGDVMGTHREQWKKAKKIPSPTSHKENNWNPHECMLSLSLAAWNSYLHNCLSPFLTWADGKGTPPKKKLKKNKIPPSPPPQKEKIQTPLVSALLRHSLTA